MESGEGRGIAIAVFHTNSTGRLAAFNGMILTGIDELHQTKQVRSLYGNGIVGYRYQI